MIQFNIVPRKILRDNTIDVSLTRVIEVNAPRGDHWNKEGEALKAFVSESLELRTRTWRLAWLLFSLS